MFLYWSKYLLVSNYVFWIMVVGYINLTYGPKPIHYNPTFWFSDTTSVPYLSDCWRATAVELMIEQWVQSRGFLNKQFLGLHKLSWSDHPRLLHHCHGGRVLWKNEYDGLLWRVTYETNLLCTIYFTRSYQSGSLQ